MRKQLIATKTNSDSARDIFRIPCRIVSRTMGACYLLIFDKRLGTALRVSPCHVRMARTMKTPRKNKLKKNFKAKAQKSTDKKHDAETMDAHVSETKGVEN